MRESVPVTCAGWAGWIVASETFGASAAGTLVAFTAKFGVGTMMIALPPMFCDVAWTRGWAAPPPTGAEACAAVACATGDGEVTTATGDAAGPGGGVEVPHAAMTRPSTPAARVQRRSGHLAMCHLPLTHDQAEPDADCPAPHDI